MRSCFAICLNRSDTSKSIYLHMWQSLLWSDKVEPFHWSAGFFFSVAASCLISFPHHPPLLSVGHFPPSVCSTTTWPFLRATVHRGCNTALKGWISSAACEVNMKATKPDTSGKLKPTNRWSKICFCFFCLYTGRRLEISNLFLWNAFTVNESHTAQN